MHLGHLKQYDYTIWVLMHLGHLKQYGRVMEQSSCTLNHVLRIICHEPFNTAQNASCPLLRILCPYPWSTGISWISLKKVQIISWDTLVFTLPRSLGFRTVLGTFLWVNVSMAVALPSPFVTFLDLLLKHLGPLVRSVLISFRYGRRWPNYLPTVSPKPPPTQLPFTDS